jgi:hypothetical protein
MVKDQSLGKQTSFRFSATAVRELDWLVRKLGQTQTTIVEASIHRLAEAEGYDRDPKELIAALLAHESGHAVLVEALMERGLRLGPDPRIEIRRVGVGGEAKVEISRATSGSAGPVEVEIAEVPSVEIERSNSQDAGPPGDTSAPRPPKVTKAGRRS